MVTSQRQPEPGDADYDYSQDIDPDPIWQTVTREPVATPLKAKEQLRQHYLTLLLPEVEKRTPVWFKVLSALHEMSPADFSPFEMSNRKLAKAAGVHVRSVPDAIRHLEGLGLRPHRRETRDESKDMSAR